MIPDWPAELHGADYCRLQFSLDFNSACELRPGSMLRLRRPLRTAARRAFGHSGEDGVLRMNRLFDPELSFDPVAVKKFQKPAPPFVITSDHVAGRAIEVGDRLDLEVLFLGTGVSLIHDFLECLIALGQIGLEQGEGRFEVSEVKCPGIAGGNRTVWLQTDAGREIVPNIHCLATYLKDDLLVHTDVRLEFVTPTRLMRGGRPLRAPGIDKLLPFMLRRVTSMLNAHCGLEVCDDPQWLLNSASHLETVAKEWLWQDWREIGQADSNESVGGVIGRIELAGPEIGQLLWVFRLAALFGIGKGAAYGAGRFRVV